MPGGGYHGSSVPLAARESQGMPPYDEGPSHPSQRVAPAPPSSSSSSGGGPFSSPGAFFGAAARDIENTRQYLLNEGQRQIDVGIVEKGQGGPSIFPAFGHVFLGSLEQTGAGAIGSLESFYNPNSPDFLSMGLNYVPVIGNKQVAQQQRQFLLNRNSIPYDVGDLAGQVLIGFGIAKAGEAGAEVLGHVAEGGGVAGRIAGGTLRAGRAVSRVTGYPFELGKEFGSAIGQDILEKFGRFGFFPDFAFREAFPKTVRGIGIDVAERSTISQGAGRKFSQDEFDIVKTRLTPQQAEILKFARPLGVSGAVDSRAESDLVSLGADFQRTAFESEQTLGKANESPVSNLLKEPGMAEPVTSPKEVMKNADQVSKSYQGVVESGTSPLDKSILRETPEGESAVIAQPNLSLALGRDSGTTIFGDVATGRQSIARYGPGYISEFSSLGYGPQDTAKIMDAPVIPEDLRIGNPFGTGSKTHVKVSSILATFDEDALKAKGYDLADIQKILEEQAPPSFRQRIGGFFREQLNRVSSVKARGSSLERPAALRAGSTTPFYHQFTEPGLGFSNVDWKSFTGTQGVGKEIINPITSGKNIPDPLGSVGTKGNMRSVFAPFEEEEQVLRVPKGAKSPSIFRIPGVPSGGVGGTRSASLAEFSRGSFLMGFSRVANSLPRLPKVSSGGFGFTHFNRGSSILSQFNKLRSTPGQKSPTKQAHQYQYRQLQAEKLPAEQELFSGYPDNWPPKQMTDLPFFGLPILGSGGPAGNKAGSFGYYVRFNPVNRDPLGISKGAKKFAKQIFG